jgi:murein DD-endopeptidase MepM/ murein hydrolase activator NlpD
LRLPAGGSYMGGRFLHVVLMPDDGGAVRNFRITATALRAVILGLIALVLALSTSLTLHLRTFREAQLLRSLQTENTALRERLGDLAKITTELEKGMEWTGDREREARLLAGLDPVDDETRRLGIGGPFLEVEPVDGISSSELRAQLRQQEVRLDALQRKLSFQKESFKEVLQTMEAGREKLARTPTICPVRSGYTLSSGFGHRTDPFTGRMGMHTGLDLRAAPGTPVVTTANGTVRFVGYNGDYGLTVRVDHGDGISTVYCHLSSSSVREGQKVSRGDRIGGVGVSGRSTGPHLHYEVHTREQPVDPRRFILTLTEIVD